MHNVVFQVFDKIPGFSAFSCGHWAGYGTGYCNKIFIINMAKGDFIGDTLYSSWMDDYEAVQKQTGPVCGDDASGCRP